MDKENNLLSALLLAAVVTDEPSPAAQALQEMATLDRHIAALRELQSGDYIKQYKGNQEERSSRRKEPLPPS